MRRSYLLAAAFALALVGWLASGQVGVQRWFAGATTTAAFPESPPAVDERPLPRVRVVTSEAAPVRREIVVYGRTEPKRDVVVRAETYGRVSELLVDKGERVAAGDPLLRLDARERAAMVEQAEALVRQRALEFEAATKLGARGFQAETQVAAAEAQLEAAHAELRAREVMLQNTKVSAPFDGLVVDRLVELGDYADTGDTLIHVMELDRFLVTGEIAETRRRLVRPGMEVAVELADGQRRQGVLTFVAPMAAEATRTFRIEVEIANADGAVPAGLSATLRLSFAEVPAHRLSAALLVLDADHRLGVKVVDDADLVRFVPVELVRAEAEAVWVAGLPSLARPIVVGQGFVHDGDPVVPVAVDDAALAWWRGTGEALP